MSGMEIIRGCILIAWHFAVISYGEDTNQLKTVKLIQFGAKTPKIKARICEIF
jgi:hypothetical protein